MTTVVNNPAPMSTDSGSNTGILVAVILVVGIAFLFFVYGIPALRSMSGGTNTVISVPEPKAPQIVIPDKIDVNINPAK